jgi:hypothetical protein
MFTHTHTYIYNHVYGYMVYDDARDESIRLGSIENNRAHINVNTPPPPPPPPPLIAGLYKIETHTQANTHLSSPMDW